LTRNPGGEEGRTGIRFIDGGAATRYESSDAMVRIYQAKPGERATRSDNEELGRDGDENAGRRCRDLGIPPALAKEDLVAIAWFMRDKVDYLYRLLEYTLVIILM
jgi:hypothetical protein